MLAIQHPGQYFFRKFQSALELLAKNADSWGPGVLPPLVLIQLSAIFNKHFGDSGTSMFLDHTSQNTYLRTHSLFPELYIYSIEFALQITS